MLLNRAVAVAVQRGLSTTKSNRTRKSTLQPPTRHNSILKRFYSESLASSSRSKPDRISFRAVEKPSVVGPDGSQLSFSQARKRPKAASASAVFGPNATTEQIADGIMAWLDEHKIEFKRNAAETNQVQVKDCPFCHDTGGKAANQHKLYIYFETATYHCFRCGSHGKWPQFISRLMDDASGDAPAMAAPPKMASVASRAPKRIPISQNVDNMDDDMPDEEPAPPPRVVKPRAAPAAASRASAAPRPLADEDDDPGNVFVTQSAPAAAPVRRTAATSTSAPASAAKSAPNVVKKRVPSKSEPAPQLEDDVPPFDEDEAAAFASEQRAFEENTAPAKPSPVTKRVAPVSASPGPKIIPQTPRSAASAQPAQSRAVPTPAAQTTPPAPAAPRKRFTTAEASPVRQQQPSNDQEDEGSSTPAKSARSTAAAAAAPSAPALSTSGKFVAPAPVAPGAEAAPKLPDQSKMPRYIEQLYTSRTDVLTYLTQERGLTEETLNKYRVGAFLLRVKDQSAPDGFVEHPCVAFGWFERNKDNPSGDLVVTRIKTRSLKSKGLQRLDPVGGKWGMFGWHLVEDQIRQQGSQRSGRSGSSKNPAYKQIIITEGEFDAMAVYQATGEIAVSLPSGANCFPVDIIEMLEPFERIIIWMDDDQVGQDGAKKLANKLGKERCVLIQTRQGQKEGPKDANDALRAGVDLKEMLNSAKPIPHQQLLHFNELRDEVRRELANPDQVAGTKSLTFPTLTKILKGHRKGELTVFTGPTGIGKTSILSQLSMDFASQNIPTLWGSFEIQNHRLAKKMLLQMSKTNLEKDISKFSEHANKFEELPLYFLRFHGGTDVDQVLDAMEYAVYVHDVEHIILDNLQFMTPTHLMKGFDKFDLLDTCVSKLRKFATYRNVHVTIIIHPRKEDDGQLLTNASVFGSAKATQEADNVVIVQRGKAFRYLEVTKNRFSGDLGLVPYKFDIETNSFSEMTEEERKEAEKANAKSRAAAKKVASSGGKKSHLAADGLPMSAPWMLPEESGVESVVSDAQEKGAVGYDLS